MLLDMLKQFKRSFIIVFTKCDKADQKTYLESEELAYKLQAKYDKMNYYVHYTSSDKEMGVEELRNHVLFKILAMEKADVK